MSVNQSGQVTLYLMPIHLTSSSGERSFSILKRVKKSKLSQSKLNYLVVLDIEQNAFNYY